MLSIRHLAAVLAAATLLPLQAAPLHHQHSHQPAHQETNMQISRSVYPFDDTVRIITQNLNERGMTIFGVIDHQAAAQKAGLTMQPATVIIFGTPKAGTPLMVKDPYFALQLPLKVLITEPHPGQVEVVMTPAAQLISGSRLNHDDVANTLANAEKLIARTVSTRPQTP